MSWQVDATSQPGVLRIRMQGRLHVADIQAFVAAHNAAIDAFAGADYRVYVDLRGLSPLSPEVAAGFEDAKRYSNAQPNFRGSAVLVESKVIALQHERTSVTSGVMSTELITDDEVAAAAHLRTVHRRV